MDPTWNQIINELSRSVPNIVGAIVILVVGWLIAIVAAWAAKAILSRTSLDNRLAGWISGSEDSAAVTNIEKWTASAVFWIIMIFVLVAFLQALQLTAVSEPLNNLLQQVFAYLPKLAGAALLLGVAWIIATLSRTLLVRGLRAFSLDEKLNQVGQGEQPTGDRPRSETAADTQPQGETVSQPERSSAAGGSPFILSETLGNALYWFIFLLFLPAILGALQLEGLLEPVRNLLDEILNILPNILAAGIIGVVGWFVARVVRLIVTNLLVATGVDRIGQRFGLNRASAGQGLSWLIGYITYIFILIPTVIAALNALQLEAISEPATDMLQQILTSLPLIFTATLILVIAYVVGKFVAELVTNVLTGLGFNNVFYWLGIQEQPQGSPDLPPAGAPGASDVSSTSTTDQQRTPSEVVGIVVLVGIILFATVPAANALGFEALTAIFTGLLVLLGRILAGLIVFAVGLYLANLAFKLINSSGSGQARILAHAARVAIIVLISAMALQQIGVATSIVNLAFGLLLGAIAVAIALAFGLGSMDIAAGEVRGWLDSFKRQNR